MSHLYSLEVLRTILRIKIDTEGCSAIQYRQEEDNNEYSSSNLHGRRNTYVSKLCISVYSDLER